MRRLNSKYRKFSIAFIELKSLWNSSVEITDKHEDMWKWNSTKRTLESGLTEFSLSQMMVG